MLSVQSALVLLIGCLIFSNLGSIDTNINDRFIVPWIGILRLRSDKNGSDAATGLILIKNHLAVGNANDVAKVKINSLRTIIGLDWKLGLFDRESIYQITRLSCASSIFRKYATAMFYKDYGWRNFRLKDYILHPEYFEDVKNTIALVYLVHNRENFHLESARWPVVDHIDDNVYSIGLTDSHRRLQQVFRKMENVMDADCDKFYKEEKLDYKSLQPSHKVCYKETDSWKKCVIDAGMALAYRNQNNWTLVGISTQGPGCSLPSRYIHLFPYIPWIKAHSRPTMTQGSLRRSYYYYEQGLEEPYEDQDTFLLSLLSNNTVVLRPSMAYVKENVYGKCNKIDGFLMYREFGTIRAPTYTATGVYSLSIYDLFFPYVTCVMVTVMCNKRSETKFWFDQGFHQEDLEDYVKTVPGPKRNTTKLPRILYIKDTYKKYRAIKTTNLQFKFEFTDEAKMDLEFYGRNVSSPMKPPNVPYLSKQKQHSGHLPDGVDFNAREDNQEDDLDKNDSFFHFTR